MGQLDADSYNRRILAALPGVTDGLRVRGRPDQADLLGVRADPACRA